MDDHIRVSWTQGWGSNMSYVPLEQFYEQEKYVVVTTTSVHRMRYVMKIEDLQKLDPDTPIGINMAVEWAKDLVAMEDVDEFSQDWIGEQIVDTDVITKAEMLELFDRDNAYLKDWSTDEKISWVHRAMNQAIGSRDDGS